MMMLAINEKTGEIRTCQGSNSKKGWRETRLLGKKVGPNYYFTKQDRYLDFSKWVILGWL